MIAKGFHKYATAFKHRTTAQTYAAADYIYKCSVEAVCVQIKILSSTNVEDPGLKAVTISAESLSTYRDEIYFYFPL